MHLRELLRFRRTNAGVVPLEVLRALRLPIPEDVLEQFVFDHGTKEIFQIQYGHLDLHAIIWQEVLLPASEILACSVFPMFGEFVAAVAERTRMVPVEGWAELSLPPGAALHWQEHGTWMRSPVMLKGDLVRSNMPLHLVEGHTRTGALRGLIESRVLSASSSHLVWVGDACTSVPVDDQWREVLRTERISFLNWLMGRVGDDGVVGAVASRLIHIQFSSMSRHRIEGDDLVAVLATAEIDEKLSPTIGAIMEAHKEWERFVEA